MGAGSNFVILSPGMVDTSWGNGNGYCVHKVHGQQECFVVYLLTMFLGMFFYVVTDWQVLRKESFTIVIRQLLNSSKIEDLYLLSHKSIDELQLPMVWETHNTFPSCGYFCMLIIFQQSEVMLVLRLYLAFPQRLRLSARLSPIP